VNDYILALDQGTTSSRAILFDRNGSVVKKAQHAFRQIYPRPGWVEHDPMDILKTQLDAARDVLRAGNVKPGQIAAVGVTNQRETAVVWERDTGKPVCNAIVWQCRRSADICGRLRAQGLAQIISDKTGLVPDAYFSATKLMWLFENIPGLKARAEKGELLFGTVDSFLIRRLTGRHLTDYTNASRTLLFNIDTLTWDGDLLDAFGIPECMLPAPLPSDGDFGAIGRIDGLEALAGVPVTGVAGDQQAALFGQACFEPGQIKNTYGTGCFALMNTGKKRVRSKSGLLTTVAWGSGGQVSYALEGSVFNAGSVIQWLRDELRLIACAPEIDVQAASVPDAGGAYFVPAFTGLGAPYWDMCARGTLVGLTRGVRREHIARAVLESIAFQVTDLIEAMRADADIEPSVLRVDGGASVSDVMMAFQADLLGIPVDRPMNVESTALGAAFLAGLSRRFWTDRAQLAGIRRSERVFTPAMAREQAAGLYSNWRRAVDRSRGWAMTE